MFTNLLRVRFRGRPLGDQYYVRRVKENIYLQEEKYGAFNDIPGTETLW